MITSRFPLGDVSFSAEYFSTLVGEATKQCYGVAAMAPRDLTDRVRSAVRGVDDSAKGVRVTQEEGRLVIELHDEEIVGRKPHIIQYIQSNTDVSYPDRVRVDRRRMRTSRLRCGVG